MSEYQCYEFLALERPLTARQMAELRAISTRAQITPRRFWNEYHYGSLRADPARLMERYFDAHLYFASWGSRRLLLRVPLARVDAKSLREYFPKRARGCARSWTAGDHFVLEACSDPDSRWFDGERVGSLEAMASLRTELMRGDHRLGYLAWLVAVQASEVDDDEQEPPVPPGLGELTPAQEEAAELLCIDVDLLAAAREGSGDSTSDERAASRRWLARLTARAKDQWLQRALDDPELPLGAEMLREVRATERHGPGRARRTVGELRQAAAAHRERRIRAEAARTKRAQRAMAAARSKRLDALAERLDAAWDDLDRLVEKSAYDAAVKLALDLRDLAARDGEANAFATRFAALRKRRMRRRGFFDRWKRSSGSDP